VCDLLRERARIFIAVDDIDVEQKEGVMHRAVLS